MGIIDGIIFLQFLFNATYVLVIITYWNEDDYALCYYGSVTSWLYEKTKMNMVGCILVAIIYYIVCPLFIPRSIGMLVYWLCHIGRRK